MRVDPALLGPKVLIVLTGMQLVHLIEACRRTAVRPRCASTQNVRRKMGDDLISNT